MVASTTASYSTQVTTVVSDPSAPGAPNGSQTPTQLQWLVQPGGGTVGTPIIPQAEVAVENASNQIVQNDFSSVTLQASGGSGNFSNTCFGASRTGSSSSRAAA